MSLLLQALQKAAKNRDEKSGNPEMAQDDDPNLMLEPLAEPNFGSDDAMISSRQDAGSTRNSSDSPEYAAGVMRASEVPSYSVLDWARDHYMLTFVGAAALFALGYGLYVYMQISNPGMFRTPPPPVTHPIQSVAPPLPPAEEESQSLRISGLPDTSMTDDAVDETSSVMANVANNTVAHEAPRPAEVSAMPERNTATPAPRQERPTAVRRKKPAPQTVAKSPVARSMDSEGVEIIEIPASPSVLTLGSASNPDTSGIAVKKQDPSMAGLDPVLLAAYQALQDGNYEKAGSLYAQVLTRSPESVDALLGLAAIAWKQGRPNVASQYYARVLEIDPRNTHAQAGLIAILGSADPISAESKLKQLIAREPTGFLYFTLGNLYAEQGLWAQAQQAYFQAFQFQPDNSDYAFNLAVGLEHLGQTGPALDYYRKALDLSFKKGKANFDQELAIERVGQLSARVK